MPWSWPILVLVPALLVAMLLAHEGGSRLQRRLTAAAPDNDSSSDEGFILSGILGLLALLLAFSFSLALNRFEERRDLMLVEASAIKNLAMTAEATDIASRQTIHTLLVRYAQSRLDAVQLPDGLKREIADRKAESLRRPLAEAIRDVVRNEEGESTVLAIIAAFDEVEDSAVRRDTLARAHLPDRVITLLAAYSVVAAAMLGYAVAASGSRQRIAASTLYVLLSFAFGVMLDLDRPSSGSITVSQEPFKDAVQVVRQSLR